MEQSATRRVLRSRWIGALFVVGAFLAVQGNAVDRLSCSVLPQGARTFFSYYQATSKTDEKLSVFERITYSLLLSGAQRRAETRAAL